MEKEIDLNEFIEALKGMSHVTVEKVSEDKEQVEEIMRLYEEEKEREEREFKETQVAKQLRRQDEELVAKAPVIRMEHSQSESARERNVFFNDVYLECAIRELVKRMDSYYLYLEVFDRLGRHGQPLSEVEARKKFSF